MQGGLEIQVKVTVKLDYNLQNKAAIVMYDALLQLYKEPVDGKFDDITETLLNDMAKDSNDDEDDDDVNVEILT